MSTVYPRRNLPSDAEAWGREVEKSLSASEKSLAASDQRLRNNRRWEAGQAAVLSRQINNLFEQSVEAQSVEDIVVNGSATSEPFPRATSTVTFPAPDVDRTAFLTVSGELVTTVSGNIQSGNVGVLHEGALVDRISSTWNYPGTIPSGWGRRQEYVSGSARITLPAGVPVVIELELIRVGDPFGSGGASNLRFRGISVGLVRGEAV